MAEQTYNVGIIKEVLVGGLTYNYNILHPDNLVGDVGVIVKKIKNFENVVCKKALEENLNSDDFCAEIVNFFPNGSKLDRINVPDEEYMRKGVGSTILKKVIDDCKRANIKFLYSKTANDSMISFLRKKGFKEFANPYDVMNHFYLPL